MKEGLKYFHDTLLIYKRKQPEPRKLYVGMHFKSCINYVCMTSMCKYYQKSYVKSGAA